MGVPCLMLRLLLSSLGILSRMLKFILECLVFVRLMLLVRLHLGNFMIELLMQTFQILFFSLMDVMTVIFLDAREESRSGARGGA